MGQWVPSGVKKQIHKQATNYKNQDKEGKIPFIYARYMEEWNLEMSSY